MSKIFFELKNKDKKYIWHPYTHPEDKTLIPIKQAKGIHLIDFQKRKFIDAISSWWVNILGHSESQIAKKIYKQALLTDQVIFANFTHKPAIVLAENIIKIAPKHFSKVFYSDDGSTSVEVALKMAIQFWNGKRKKIVALENSYHGDTLGSMSVSARGVFTKHFRDLLFEVEYIPTPTEETKMPKIDWSEVATFIYEPLVQGAGGMKMYSKNTMNKILAEAKKNQVLLIADEVMTGFGRTGTMFASEQLSESPDFICLSKGITTGYLPLAVTIIKDKIFDYFNTANTKQPFYHGHSYTANPLACAAANACLEILLKNRESYEKKWKGMEKLYYHFAHRIENYPQVKNIRTCGTIFAFDIQTEEEKEGYTNSVGKVIKEFCLSKGVLIRPLGNTIYIMPPYCIKNKEMAKIFDTLKQAIQNL